MRHACAFLTILLLSVQARPVQAAQEMRIISLVDSLFERSIDHNFRNGAMQFENAILLIRWTNYWHYSGAKAFPGNSLTEATGLMEASLAKLRQDSTFPLEGIAEFRRLKGLVGRLVPEPMREMMTSPYARSLIKGAGTGRAVVQYYQSRKYLYAEILSRQGGDLIRWAAPGRRQYDVCEGPVSFAELQQMYQSSVSDAGCFGVVAAAMGDALWWPVAEKLAQDNASPTEICIIPGPRFSHISFAALIGFPAMAVPNNFREMRFLAKQRAVLYAPALAPAVFAGLNAENVSLKWAPLPTYRMLSSELPAAGGADQARLMELWSPGKPYDTALMSGLRTNLAKNMPAALALRAAQTALMVRPELASPKFWAFAALWLSVPLPDQ